MTTLATRDDFDIALAEAAAQCDFALERVAQIEDERTLGEAKIAVNAAKELARLNKTASALRPKLTRLELHIARKAGQIGATVSGVTASTAKWYADKTDAEIDALIQTHHGKSAPASIMKAEIAATEYRVARARAAQPESIGRLEVGDAGESLAAIITAVQDEFYDRDSIGVEELTDYVGDLVGVPSFDDNASVAATEGLRLGLWDAVRKSLANGELDDPRLEGLPRWITCMGRDDLAGDRRYNIRVPTAKATLRQLGEYVELLDRKGRQTLRRAEAVDAIRQQLLEAVRAAADVDGEHAMFPTSVGEAALLMLTPPAEETGRSPL